MYEFLHGKCEDILPGFSEKSVNTVVTSPPYNRGIKYRTYIDSMADPVYITWVETWARQIKRVLADNGSFFLNLGGSPSKPWMPHEIVSRLRHSWVLQNTFIWVKAISINESESRGHFKPINSDRFENNCWEFVFHFTKHGDASLDRLALGVNYVDTSNIKRWKHTGGKNLRARGNVWFIPYPTIQNRQKQRPHPAVFPPELPMFCCLLTHPKRVLDPFVGIGNSAVGALRASVPEFTGIDMDEEYLVQARESLQKAA